MEGGRRWERRPWTEGEGGSEGRGRREKVGDGGRSHTCESTGHPGSSGREANCNSVASVS